MDNACPCRKCPFREASCHGKCEPYRAWAAEQRRQKREYRDGLPEMDMERDLYFRGRQTHKGVLERRREK